MKSTLLTTKMPAKLSSTSIPFSPHKYQETAIEFLVSRSNAGLFLSPGLGKTSITLAAFKILKKCGFADKMLVIAPLRPCYSVWPAEVKKWDQFKGLSVGILHGAHKLKVLNAKHDIYVVNPEGLRWLFTTLRTNMPFDMLVVDECFPRGTMVNTPLGMRRIETLNTGDVVHNAVGLGTVQHVRTKWVTKLVRLKLENSVILSTPEHPIFTTRGWRCAKDCEGFEVLDYKRVSDLWDTVRGNGDSSGAELSRSLLEILRAEADVDTETGAPRSGVEVDDQTFNRAPPLEQGCSLGGGYKAEAENCSKEQQSARKFLEGPQRQRNGDDPQRSAAGEGTAADVYMELPNSIGSAARRISYELQSGLRGSDSKDSDRGRRTEPQQCSAKTVGQEEDREVRGARVESVESIELGHPEEVWNLEVSGHPSYFVNDVLVHNCSRFKHVNTERFKTLKPYLGKFKRRVILTGSPAPNSLLDLFGQMYVLDMGKTLSPYIGQFRTKFFSKRQFEVRHPNPEKAANGETLVVTDWHITKEKAQDLYAHIAPSVLRMSAEDHLDIPPLLLNDIYIDLPPRARAMYDQFEKALRLDFRAGKVTAANAAIVGMKCRQIANGGIYLDDLDKKWENIHTTKADAVAELVEELEGEPALIAYEFLHDLDRLKTALGRGTPHIGGGVSGKLSQKIIDAWNRGEVPALLGQPQSMAHGLNMQESGDTIIYHSMIWNFEDYSQFIKRVHRQGKRRRVTLHRIIARDTVDEVVVAALARKDATQNSLFDAIKQYWS